MLVTPNNSHSNILYELQFTYSKQLHNAHIYWRLSFFITCLIRIFSFFAILYRFFTR